MKTFDLETEMLVALPARLEMDTFVNTGNIQNGANVQQNAAGNGNTCLAFCGTAASQNNVGVVHQWGANLYLVGISL